MTRLPLRLLMWVLDSLHIDAPDNHHRPWVLCATCRAFQRGIWWMEADPREQTWGSPEREEGYDG